MRQLLNGEHACIRIVTHEEDYALGLLRDYALASSRPLWIWSAVGGVREGLLADSAPIKSTEDPVDGLNWLRAGDRRPVCIALGLAGHLKQPRPLRAALDLITTCRKTGTQLVLLDHGDDCPPVIRTNSTPLELSLPDRDELEGIVRATLRRCHRQQSITIDIDRHELDVIVRNLSGLSRRQAADLVLEAVADDHKLDASDINRMLARKRQLIASDGLLDFVRTPVSLDEVGGLRRLKRWLDQRKDAMSQRAADFGIDPPRGVLMLGVQGAGKSLCAKAIATAWQRPLLRMDVGALYDKYVGASEQRLRGALRQAERMSPNVLWIDEIEKAFASAAAQSTDGGLSKRMFGALLTWMQEHEQPVFLIATANDIEALPPELLRKGRFDEIFFVDLPAADVRRQIFAIHLTHRGRKPDDFELDKLAEAADGFSGAEIEQTVAAALHAAFAAGEELSTRHIVEAIQSTAPLSVTMAERIQALRAWARERCAAAD